MVNGVQSIGLVLHLKVSRIHLEDKKNRTAVFSLDRTTEVFGVVLTKVYIYPCYLQPWKLQWFAVEDFSHSATNQIARYMANGQL